MPARTPEEADQLIAQAITAGDLEAAVALYGPNASMVPEPGKVATGTAGIREALGGFLALKPKLDLQLTNVVQAGDLALLTSKWTLAGTGPDGSAVNLAGRGTEVVRRQPDGTWLFVIDNPFGGD